MIPTRIWAAVALVALVACRDKPPEPPKVSQVFPNLPLPPNATLVSKSGSSDALQLTLRSPVQAKHVEAYYRDLLSKNGWRLINDMRDRDGSVVLFAEQDGPPLWVRITGTEDSLATIVQLAGAVFADSAKRVKPAS
jgi:hypothetical protein